MAEVYANPDLVSEALRPFREAAEQADPSKAAWMIANLELQAAAIRKSIAEGEQAMEQAMAGETPMVTIEDVLDGIPDAYEDAMENLEHARAGETIDEAEALLDSGGRRERLEEVIANLQSGKVQPVDHATAVAALAASAEPIPQGWLDAAAAELARQHHGGPADPDDIKLASEVLSAALSGGSGIANPCAYCGHDSNFHCFHAHTGGAACCERCPDRVCARPAGANKGRRLSVNVALDVAAAIEALTGRHDITIGDVVRRAVSAYKYLDDEKVLGRRVFMERNGTYREVKFL